MKFNDQVEMLHIVLLRDEKYRALLRAVYDAHAVEGSLALDDAMAAQMIRDKAREQILPDVGGCRLDQIVRGLHVVLRRYGMSRKNRRPATELDDVIIMGGPPG